MLRCSCYRLSEEMKDQILFNRLRDRHVPGKFSLRAVTASRLQGWAAATGIVLGTAFFLGPWMWDEWQELLHKKFVPMDPSSMPRTSPTWWENEWRKGNTLWRAGETATDFYQDIYAFVRAQTGRDLSTAETFVRTHPHSTLTNGRNQKDDASPPAPPPAVLVPLCGDSLIMRTMATQGYEVHGVDASETAMRSAVERTERLLPLDAFKHMHLHWKDFFSPDLWEGPLKGQRFDIIYERQAMTSLNRDQRPDYVYLLKQALKEDGLIYVEGIFRTGRVKGNKVRGPPYSLSRKELEGLFPGSEGYFVRCEEKSDAMIQLSREDRILQRVPRKLYVTPFKCVVFKAAAVNLKERDTFVAAARVNNEEPKTTA